jgi:hypothetical protein
VAVSAPTAAVTVWLAGQLIVGAGAFVTVMVKLQLPPPLSETTLITVVPTGKNEPEAGVAVTAPQLPAITLVAVKVTNLPGFPS